MSQPAQWRLIKEPKTQLQRMAKNTKVPANNPKSSFPQWKQQLRSPNKKKNQLVVAQTTAIAPK